MAHETAWFPRGKARGDMCDSCSYVAWHSSPGRTLKFGEALPAGDPTREVFRSLFLSVSYEVADFRASFSLMCGRRTRRRATATGSLTVGR